MSTDRLRSRRILVAEDDPLLALGYDEILRDAGATVLGPAASVEQAQKLVAENGISAALLDVRLADGEVWPLARLLAGKGVPFAFCTGHFSHDTLPDEWANRPIITKPARADKIVGVIAELLSESSS